MPYRRRLNTVMPTPPHDYQLEPPDEIIAELQSTVVQSRQLGTRTRTELLEDLVAAARELPHGHCERDLVRVAALAVLLRMGAA